MGGLRWTREEYQAYLAEQASKAKSKYNARPTEVNAVRFASKKESSRYIELEALRRSGDVKFFVLQPVFVLPGGVKYKADFLVIWSDGRCTIEDTKGVRTPVYRLKKRQVEEIYGVEITET